MNKSWEETAKSTPKVRLYLKLGRMPNRFILMKMKIIYLHYILHQYKESFISRLRSPILFMMTGTSQLRRKLNIFNWIYHWIRSQFCTSLKNLMKPWNISIIKIKNKTKNIVHDQMIIQPYLRARKMSNVHTEEFSVSTEVQNVGWKC